MSSEYWKKTFSSFIITVSFVYAQQGKVCVHINIIHSFDYICYHVPIKHHEEALLFSWMVDDHEDALLFSED